MQYDRPSPEKGEYKQSPFHETQTLNEAVGSPRNGTHNHLYASRPNRCTLHKVIATGQFEEDPPEVYCTNEMASLCPGELIGSSVNQHTHIAMKTTFRRRIFTERGTFNTVTI
jgi:hypothetical protein